MVRSAALVLGAAIACLSITPALAQDEAKRFKIIERLQSAGSATGSLSVCEGAGYERREDAHLRYAQREVGFATEDGMAEETAWGYVTAGMRSRTGQDEVTMNRIRRMIQAEDPKWRVAAETYVKEVAKRCDLIASMPDTAGLFSYAPANADVAARLMRNGLGLKAPAAKP